MDQERIDAEEAVRRLDALSGGDPEIAHSDADQVLLKVVDPLVLAAYLRVVARCSWWACA